MYDRADFSAFNARHPENFDRFLRFLEKNGLTHSYQPGQENPDFLRRLQTVDFPAGVRPLFGGGDEAIEQLLGRLRWLYQGENVDRARKVGAYNPKPFGNLPKPVAKLPEPEPARIPLRVRALKRARKLVRRIRR